MESNFASEYDKEWLTHELSELHHEQEFGSGYSEAHDRAQSKFNGAPWPNENDQN